MFKFIGEHSSLSGMEVGFRVFLFGGLFVLGFFLIDEIQKNFHRIVTTNAVVKPIKYSLGWLAPVCSNF